MTRELRHAVRRAIARPAFTITAMLTLGLGVGSTTAVFSVVDAVLLEPLPWRNAHELVRVWVVRPHWRDDPVLSGSWDRGNLSWPIFEDLRTKSRVFSEVATFMRRRPILHGERNEPVYGLQVSASLLPMLGVTPHLGRFFTPDEDESRTDAALISYESWQRRFGGASDVLGRRISLDEIPYTIVGVLPPGFDFDGQSPIEFVTPWGNVPAGDRNPGNHFMDGIARLKPGVSLEDATRDSTLQMGDERGRKKESRLVRLEDEQLGPSRRPLWTLLGASALLLLVACANVAGLLLGDAASRRHELAVRLALGASRVQVARQLFGESVVLAAGAVAAGVAFALTFTPMLVALAPAQLPRMATVTVDVRVLAFAVASGIVTAIVFSMGPALALSAPASAQSLKEGGRDAGARRSRSYRTIVAAEVALAVALMAGASLLAETVLRMTRRPVGFDPDNLVVASLRLPRNAFAKPVGFAARTDAVVARLATLPGVVDAAATSTAPFSGSYGSNGIEIEGKTFQPQASANRHIVTERYLQTMRIPVLKGRGFEPTDLPGDHVAVVTDEFERRYMDGDAIGKRFVLNREPHRVVGVVQAPKHREYTDETTAAFYGLNRQLPSWSIANYIVRTATPPDAMLGAIRKAIEDAEPAASILTLESMTAMMRRSIAEERYRALLALLFAGAALMLAAVGLYGLVARSVADRQREIGVRMAMGAHPARVLRLVLREAMLLVAIGLLIGVPISVASSQVVAALLYGVTPTTPHTFVIVAAVLMAAALAASLLPARRAARLDPLAALRQG